ncbi:MAG: hypothetical protein PF961_14870 [Planctomycetota bacterium]|nr:hypothetical protein [Planctomycetota bacterium]
MAFASASEMINGIPVPPSPGDPDAHPGLRIWDEPSFTHYPAVVYADEVRNLAFSIPVPPERSRDREAGLDRPDGAYHNPFGWTGGDSGTIGWTDSDQWPITLPLDAELQRVSGLLPLPTGEGVHEAAISIAGATRSMHLRVSAVRGTWPHDRLENGFPVDHEGVPVVLMDRRRDPDAERQWAALRTTLPRPTGQSLVIGDPLASTDGDVWGDLTARTVVATDERYPHHALLVALAKQNGALPRTVLWSPGNAPVNSRVWSPEEERVLAAVRGYYEHRAQMPRLVLLLPPLPAEPDLVAKAEERRDQLRRSALFLGWAVVDAAAAAGAPEGANRVGEGVYAIYPTGPARLRVAAAVAAALVE